MFDIGWGELVVIGIVALIAIGPKELPTVLRTIGQYMAKVRRMASEFQGQFQDALREVEVADLKKQADEMASSVGNFTNFDPMASAQKEMEAAFNPETPLETPTPSEPAAEPSPAASLGAPEPAPALPPIDVPLPDLPPPLTNEDFAPKEAPSQETGKPEPAKQAGGST